jgi:streptogramin lyase
MRLLRTSLPVALLFTASAALAQAPMEDVLWVASRGSVTLTKITRFGQVLKVVDMTPNGFGLRGVFRAPDGKLWLINFITTTFTILDRDGKVLLNVPTTGSPYAVAFDKTGDAWISGATANSVDRYSPAGKFIQSYMVGPSPLGVAVDYSTPANSGNVWVAHRVGPPGQVSKIDIATGKVTTYTLPATEPMMPTRVLCDYQGVAKDSNIWVGGDSSANLVNMDQNGNVIAIYPLPGYGYTAGLAIDRDNNIWATGRSGPVFKLDNATGKILLQFNGAPVNSDCGGVVMDSIGRPWIMDRGWSVDGALQRFDLNTGALEVLANGGTNTYGMVDAAGFSYAYVTNPFGDEDKDGTVNFLEITNGTSPYDPLSNPNLSFDTRGVSRVGKVPYLDAVSATAGTTVVFFSVNTGPGLTVPGFNGQFLLDLGTLFYTLPMPSPGKLNLPIPNNPALAFISYQMQGLFVDTTTLAATFTNTSGITISP